MAKYTKQQLMNMSDEELLRIEKESSLKKMAQGGTSKPSPQEYISKGGGGRGYCGEHWDCDPGQYCDGYSDEGTSSDGLFQGCWGCGVDGWPCGDGQDDACNWLGCPESGWGYDWCGCGELYPPNWKPGHIVDQSPQGYSNNWQLQHFGYAGYDYGDSELIDAVVTSITIPVAQMSSTGINTFIQDL